ncbi:hypothetical protein FDP41_007278 [Naegleria fowleri]|uniref:BPP domain-containing protein n=1 Tax=Naegleria fowleri TaxID=5763 RepID=A0A6A5BHH3_NAEFO|nr:uncharacterized protein FDP41_007278 [Naegleria fowleri]KAF0973891.1 hypothetical protein FDP41_007278 [Naegleria fowleri]CAG4711086.1 unnamed protein product [Naegleria fowleri]
MQEIDSSETTNKKTNSQEEKPSSSDIVSSSSTTSSKNVSTSGANSEGAQQEQSDLANRIMSLMIMISVVVVAFWLRSQNKNKSQVDVLERKLSVFVVPELFVTGSEGSQRRDNIDSLVVLNHKWLITTAKATNSLFVFDAKTGEYLFTKHLKTGDYEANRPNGITLYKIFNKDFLFVTERDGKRVCIVDIESDFKILYSFGNEILQRPYALDIIKTEKLIGPNSEHYHVFVTDNYMIQDEKGKHKIVPPQHLLDKRVQLFEVVASKKENSEITFEASYSKKIGSITENVGASGALNIVETIVIDEAYNRLLIADEHELNVKIYNFKSHDFSGETLGLTTTHEPSDNSKCPKNFFFEGEPEGFVIFSCQTTQPARNVKTGFYIFTDQLDKRTKFHIVRRDNLCYVASFMGNVVSKTDGVTIDETLGIFYAVHNDSVIGTFKLDDIVQNVVKKNLDSSEFKKICPR